VKQFSFAGRLAAVALTVTMIGGAYAADPAPSAMQTGTQATSADRTFMTKAAGGGMYEVAVSKLAAEKATSPAVKDYAQMLVTDHTAANDQLKALAATKGVALPADMPADKKAKLNALAKTSGATFDRAYIDRVGITDHQADIRLFDTASRSAKDADVKAWAAKTLPTLKEHLTEAQGLSKEGRQGSRSPSAKQPMT